MELGGAGLPDGVDANPAPASPRPPVTALPPVPLNLALILETGRAFSKELALESRALIFGNFQKARELELFF